MTSCAATPPCQLAPDLVAGKPANAGCLVRESGRLLVVRDRLSGRLGFPAGRSLVTEPAACTAHRETWEETGYRVEVLRLLETFRGGFRLYLCQLTDPQAPVASVPRPPQAVMEIESIHWFDPHTLDPADWRFPEQLPRVLELFDVLDDGS